MINYNGVHTPAFKVPPNKSGTNMPYTGNPSIETDCNWAVVAQQQGIDIGPEGPYKTHFHDWTTDRPIFFVDPYSGEVLPLVTSLATNSRFMFVKRDQSGTMYFDDNCLPDIHYMTEDGKVHKYQWKGHDLAILNDMENHSRRVKPALYENFNVDKVIKREYEHTYHHLAKQIEHRFGSESFVAKRKQEYVRRMAQHGNHITLAHVDNDIRFYKFGEVEGMPPDLQANGQPNNGYHQNPNANFNVNQQPPVNPYAAGTGINMDQYGNIMKPANRPPLVEVPAVYDRMGHDYMEHLMNGGDAEDFVDSEGKSPTKVDAHMMDRMTQACQRSEEVMNNYQPPYGSYYSRPTGHPLEQHQHQPSYNPMQQQPPMMQQPEQQQPLYQQQQQPRSNKPVNPKRKIRSDEEIRKILGDRYTAQPPNADSLPYNDPNYLLNIDEEAPEVYNVEELKFKGSRCAELIKLHMPLKYTVGPTTLDDFYVKFMHNISDATMACKDKYPGRDEEWDARDDLMRSNGRLIVEYGTGVDFQQILANTREVKYILENNPNDTSILVNPEPEVKPEPAPEVKPAPEIKPEPEPTSSSKRPKRGFSMAAQREREAAEAQREAAAQDSIIEDGADMLKGKYDYIDDIDDIEEDEDNDLLDEYDDEHDDESIEASIKVDDGSWMIRQCEEEEAERKLFGTDGPCAMYGTVIQDKNEPAGITVEQSIAKLQTCFDGLVAQLKGQAPAKEQAEKPARVISDFEASIDESARLAKEIKLPPDPCRIMVKTKNDSLMVDERCMFSVAATLSSPEIKVEKTIDHDVHERLSLGGHPEGVCYNMLVPNVVIGPKEDVIWVLVNESDMIPCWLPKDAYALPNNTNKINGVVSYDANEKTVLITVNADAVKEILVDNTQLDKYKLTAGIYPNETIVLLGEGDGFYEDIINENTDDVYVGRDNVMIEDAVLEGELSAIADKAVVMSKDATTLPIWNTKVNIPMGLVYPDTMLEKLEEHLQKNGENERGVQLLSQLIGRATKAGDDFGAGKLDRIFVNYLNQFALPYLNTEVKSLEHGLTKSRDFAELKSILMNDREVLQKLYILIKRDFADIFTGFKAQRHELDDVPRSVSVSVDRGELEELLDDHGKYSVFIDCVRFTLPGVALSGMDTGLTTGVLRKTNQLAYTAINSAYEEIKGLDTYVSSFLVFTASGTFRVIRHEGEFYVTNFSS